MIPIAITITITINITFTITIAITITLTTTIALTLTLTFTLTIAIIATLAVTMSTSLRSAVSTSQCFSPLVPSGLVSRRPLSLLRNEESELRCRGLLTWFGPSSRFHKSGGLFAGGLTRRALLFRASSRGPDILESTKYCTLCEALGPLGKNPTVPLP